MSKKKKTEEKKEQNIVDVQQPEVEVGTDVVPQSAGAKEEDPAVQSDIVEEGPNKTVGEEKYARILSELEKSIEEADKYRKEFPSLKADHLYVELKKLKDFIATAP